MKDLPALIKTARERRGFSSQSALAQAIGRDQSFVSRLERGAMKELPAPEVLQVFSDVLGISMEDILIAAGYLEVPSTDNEAVVMVRADDPRADLLRLLDGETDLAVRNAAALISAAKRMSGTSILTKPDIPSGRNETTTESPDSRTA